MPFRDAYHYVKEHLDELQSCDPFEAIAKKKHEGATAGLDFVRLGAGAKAARKFAAAERAAFSRKISALLGVPFPMP